MKITITFIELKSPFKFFALSYSALSIAKQLKDTNCKGFKKKGFWTKHYTMTLWNNEEDLIELQIKNQKKSLLLFEQYLSF